MIVLLTKQETQLIFSVARQRFNDNLNAKRKDYNGAEKRNGELLHIVGALGELATAKLLGLQYCLQSSIAYQYQAGDLNDLLEVRTRGSLAYDYMFVHDKDKLGSIYIHAKLTKPTPSCAGMYYWPSRAVNVVGWIKSEDAHKHKETKNFGDANSCCHERFLSNMTSCPFRQ